MTPKFTRDVIKIGVAAFVAILIALFLFATPANANNGNGQEKVTICHNTSSETNPQVEITIAVPALEAHVANHEDGEFDTEGPCPVDETTTTSTTVVDETTTTTIDNTVTIIETTTTTLPFDEVGPTAVVEEVVTTTTVAPAGPAITELPYTGVDPVALGGLAALFASSGAYLVRKGRR